VLRVKNKTRHFTKKTQSQNKNEFQVKPRKSTKNSLAKMSAKSFRNTTRQRKKLNLMERQSKFKFKF